MKLHQLISYKQTLESSDLKPLIDRVDRDLGIFKTDLEINQFDSANFKENFNKSHQSVVAILESCQNQFDQYRMMLEAEIRKQEKPYYQQSYDLFYNQYISEPVDKILQRSMTMSAGTVKLLKERINLYVSWKYPGLCLHPVYGNFIESMVALDPLYLVDVRYELLEMTKSKFNSRYQQRLRSYVINEHLPKNKFQKLPDGQMGFVLALNFFNYRPLEVIKEYLVELKSKIRPGGAILFTYNNCDRAPYVILVEKTFACYTPGALLRSIVDGLGYEIVNHYEHEHEASWIECKVPGELSSIRGGQALAEVIKN